METQEKVTLANPFYCSKFEITQGQWTRVMGSNPSKFTGAGDNAPVEQVSWDDCQRFLSKLCELEGVPQGSYSLLNIAQWEYACRAGTSSTFYNGKLKIQGACNSSLLDEIGWYRSNSEVSYSGGFDLHSKKNNKYSKRIVGTHPVGGKKANAFGLYDMLGNVSEWCYFIKEPASAPSARWIRGGSWFDTAIYCRAAKSGAWDSSKHRNSLGFRIMRIITVKNRTTVEQVERDKGLPAKQPKTNKIKSIVSAFALMKRIDRLNYSDIMLPILKKIKVGDWVENKIIMKNMTLGKIKMVVINTTPNSYTMESTFNGKKTTHKPVFFDKDSLEKTWNANIRKISSGSITIKGKKMSCYIFNGVEKTSGSNVKIYVSPKVPLGILKFEMKRIITELVDYGYGIKK